MKDYEQPRVTVSWAALAGIGDRRELDEAHRDRMQVKKFAGKGGAVGLRNSNGGS